MRHRGAVALDVSEALSGKLLNRRMQGVHARSIADERSYDTAAGVYIQAIQMEGEMGIFIFLVPAQFVCRLVLGALLFSALIVVMSQPAFSEITDSSKPFSMLCVPKKGTGFDWKNNDWQQATYKPSTYVLSKLGGDAAKEKCWTQILSEGVDISDPIASGTSRGCYIIKELGESEKDVLGDVCTEHWDERGKGPVLNEVSCSFNYEVRARVDGPFVLTRTNAIFATEDRFRTSVSLEIGKCSLFEG
jgi:hypothetical protein